MSEIWKTAVVDGVENPRYQVSNMGRVKCLDWRYIGKEKICKLSGNGRGYLEVGIDQKMKTVHRIVAETFIPNPSGKSEVDHINTDKTDNRVDNLRWCTHKENMNNTLTRKYKSETCVMLGKIGAEHPASISVVQLTKYGVFVKKWDSIMDVYRELGVDFSHITHCCRGKQKTAGGFRWMYATDYNPIRRSISAIRPLF